MKNIVAIITLLTLLTCTISKPTVSVQDTKISQKNQFLETLDILKTYPCSYCDSLINQNLMHVPPKRYVNIDGWHIGETVGLESDNLNVQREINRIFPFREGPIRIFNTEEFKQLKDNRFCFLGKSKEALKFIFHESDEIISTENGLYFSYWIGNIPHRVNGKPSDFRLEEQRYLQFLNFSSDSIFIGSKEDSIQLEKYIDLEK